jgi:SAM-dependent methyltransferase
MRLIERAKSFVKKFRTPGMAEIFSGIYRGNEWADAESVSGRGSTLERTVAVRGALPALLESVGARSLLDAPCGDFNWMRHVDLAGVEYTGADVVPDLIARNRLRYEGNGRRFVVLDITSDRLPWADVILCRDCFIHLSFKHIHAAVANFKRSNSAYLLATTHTKVQENRDIETGGWRSVNLQLPPFNFPSPIRLITEDPEPGKCLGLWSLEKL